jgi:hypothetical protein
MLDVAVKGLSGIYIRLTCCDYKKEEGERVKEEGHVGGCTGALRW